MGTRDTSFLIAHGLMSEAVVGECEFMMLVLVVPVLKPGKNISFSHFDNCGFRVLAHSFLRGFLYFYCLQLNDLNLNGVLHLAMFVMLCECYLGFLST